MTRLEKIKAQSEAASEDREPNMPTRLMLFREFRDELPWLLERVKELAKVARRVVRQTSGTVPARQYAIKTLAELDEETS